ncbi:MAG: D-alanyl-D-alanine carboxypeptidase [Alphaproteobacteria bacterium]|nr:D-alanyl-D-alanine carboxypeptidase [Alphaproteobacteria bacterium]
MRLGFLQALLLGAALSLGLAGSIAAFETTGREAILIDDTTGAVLMEKNADQLMPPSSMSKIMTVYMVFERLRDGSIKLTDELPISERAWRMQGSKMFVDVNSRVSVDALLHGVIVQSGNDATVALAEGLGGTEEAFAARMTERAHELGMTNSTFLNASGWPQEGHLTTARDLATLASHMIHDFPEFYPLFAETEYEYNGISQGNRNPLLYKNVGADGLKTGHTEEAGYGLTASAVRDGRRLILVVNGLGDVNTRSEETERLLDWGFRETTNYALIKADEPVVDADVWHGDTETVPLVLAEPLVVTLTREARAGMTVKVIYDGPLPAPIAKGTQVGRIVVSAPGYTDVEHPLLAGTDVGTLSTLRRLLAAAVYLVRGGGG